MQSYIIRNLGSSQATLSIIHLQRERRGIFFHASKGKLQREEKDCAGKR